MSQLVQLAMLHSGPIPDNNIDHISKAAQFALSQALGSMHAVDFVNAVLTMLHSGNVQVSCSNEILFTRKLTLFQIQTGALDLLESRLNQVASTVRKEVTSTINGLVECIQQILSSSGNPTVAISALKALKSIAETMCPGEETSLTKALTSVLEAIQNRNATAAAMTALLPLV